MLNALADAVIEKTHLEYKRKNRVEGSPSGGWLVLDFGSVVVHLFAPDIRDYYRLEELWSEGKVLLRLQ
jgi:ribosome-associated protein